MLFIVFCWFVFPTTLAFNENPIQVSPVITRALNNSVNVRTVLFRDTDTCKVCWSKEDINLLIARRLVQDLVPRKIPRDFPALYTYLTSVIETIKAKTSEKNMQTMLLAAYDALGGYLHAVAIPILNEAFYAGNVDFTTTSNLHGLLGTMMEYLGTNGNPWAPPCDMRKIPTKVAALPLKLCKTFEACNAFVLPNASSITLNRTVDECDGHAVPAVETKIQIPFLDDNAYPGAIAIPLREHPLFSLMSECAVNIVPKYYILAMRCLSSPNFTNKDIVTFNKELHRWIIATVVPHLHEMDRWYPGFGGIMRVVETMNQRGLASNEVIRPDIREGNNSVCVDFPEEPVCIWASPSFFSKGMLTVLVFCIIGLLALLMTVCLIRCCIACIRARQNGDEEAKDKFTNTLVNLYCGIKGRPLNTYEGDVTQAGESSRRLGSSAASYEGGESSEEEYEETE